MLGTKYRGRRRGIAVREGSVEQARREAKLTLAQVAGGTLTRTAIHLIEKGRTRPSIETLQQTARPDGKPDEAPRAGTADSRQGAAQSRRNGHSASCGRVEPGRQGPSSFLRRPGVLPAGATS